MCLVAFLSSKAEARNMMLKQAAAMFCTKCFSESVPRVSVEKLNVSLGKGLGRKGVLYNLISKQ